MDTRDTTLSLETDALPGSSSSFDAWRRASGFWLAPSVSGMTYLFAPSSLTRDGRTTAAILAGVAVLWVTEAIPLPVTALLGATMCILFGVAEAKTMLASFADPVVFLFIGSFMIAQAMRVHGVDRRMAHQLTAIWGKQGSPARLVGGIGLITGLLSMWISNAATTAMIQPIAIGIVCAIERNRGPAGRQPARSFPSNTKFGTGMLLMVAYAASIGGIGTPVGSPPNLITIGALREFAKVEINFVQWMLIALPMLVVMGVTLFILIWLLHLRTRPGDSEVTRPDRGNRQENREERKKRIRVETESVCGPAVANERLSAVDGPWSRGQINVLAAFILAVCFWVLPGILSVLFPDCSTVHEFFRQRLPEAVVALLAAILLFLLPIDWRRGQFTLDWPTAVQLDWGIVLLFGGGLGLGQVMFETGVAAALGRGVSDFAGAHSLWTLTAVSIGMGIILSETTSNTACASMIVPLVIAMARDAGISPVPPALGACFGASFGFMLPVSTPPNAIVYSSGLIPITAMIRAGVIFDVLGFVIIWVTLRLLCPVLGLQ